MTDNDRCKADPDLISEGEADGIAWEVRVCDDLCTVTVTHLRGATQAVSLTPAVADAIGPALVLAAKRLRGWAALYCPRCAEEGYATLIGYDGQEHWWCPRVGPFVLTREEAMELGELPSGLTPWPETETGEVPE